MKNNGRYLVVFIILIVLSVTYDNRLTEQRDLKEKYDLFILQQETREAVNRAQQERGDLY